MTINEVAKELNITKRAIKFYEEKGLIAVAKDRNGYRNYSAEDVKRLKRIALYRKLGISVSDIQKMLDEENKDVLVEILDNKEKELRAIEVEYDKLKKYVLTGQAEDIYDEIEYKTIGRAMTDAVPGFYGYYFINHFLPYLQGTIETQEQKEAYAAICEFWDHTEIKIPLMMRLSGWISYRLGSELSAEKMAKKMDAQMKLYLEPNEAQYEKLKKQVLEGYRMKKLMRFHPAFVSQRKFMRELQNKGYNDIFIPNMKKLSPDYKKYHDALTAANLRICSELGLYYDTNFNLLRKKA